MEPQEALIHVNCGDFQLLVFVADNEEEITMADSEKFRSMFYEVKCIHQQGTLCLHIYFFGQNFMMYVYVCECLNTYNDSLLYCSLTT